MRSDISALGIYGWGLHLPPSQSIEDIVSKAGGDASNFLSTGWQKVCVATEAEHPDGMCLMALERALSDAKLDRGQLNLVICTSQTHNYPDISTAGEVMRELGTGPECVGFDIHQGCITTLTALDIARGWLNARGGGYAAVISGERQVEGFDRTDSSTEFMWGFADGASAIIVGLDTKEQVRLNYHGACFHTNNIMAGHSKLAYGGTVSPTVPPGKSPYQRIIQQLPPEKLQRIFLEGYSKVIEMLKKQFSAEPEWLVCNQGGPGVLEALEYLTCIDGENIARTGAQFGHVGCSDVIIGLDYLAKNKRLAGKGMALTSNYSCWGAGFFTD